MSSHIKLFSPGPVEVSEKTFQAFRKPMIGHRGNDFKKLYLLRLGRDGGGPPQHREGKGS
jgi:aspartate aminotransferase-like enzyme